MSSSNLPKGGIVGGMLSTRESIEREPAWWAGVSYGPREQEKGGDPSPTEGKSEGRALGKARLNAWVAWEWLPFFPRQFPLLFGSKF